VLGTSARRGRGPPLAALAGTDTMPIIKWAKKNYETSETWKARIARYAVGVPIFLGVYLVLALFSVYPHWPIDLTGWSILIFAGIPASLCLELIGNLVFTEERGQKISSSRLSAKRVVIALLIFIVIVSAFVLLWFAYGSLIRAHFK
jgi:phosphatidylserine synthase